MVNDAKKLQTLYTEWLGNSIKFSDIGSNIVRIDTPFLDSSFDDIIMYVETLKNDTIIITDDGYTLDNLSSMGLTIDGRSRSRKKILDIILNEFGIECDNATKELFIKTTLDKFAISKQRLLQAILKVNDMSFLSSDNVKNTFRDDIAEILKKRNVLFDEGLSFPGKGGITFHFDFSVPSRNKNSKLVRAITKPNDLNYSKIFAVDANMVSQNKKADFIAILDDSKNDVTNTAELNVIFNEYNNIKIDTINFSDLQKNESLLTNY
nr:DUF1828 domain-containing protein [Carnobacterium maltaromaticum]